MIGREIGPYKILDRLGGGGMGVVYKAEDLRLGRPVALKFLNTELLANESIRKRFLREARAASLIDHPNVCHVYEVGEADDGRTYMVMSFCEGKSLRDLIQEGPVAPREAFGIAFGVAQGLWAAHRRNIVHRDIKPANVILTDDGFVRIVDFGLALLIGESSVTTSGVTVGTVAYMSPEQTTSSDVGPNTDIWSLGVTLYELLTGHLPFRGDVKAALGYSIVHEPYETLPSSIPMPVARVIDRCLQKDPAQRYQTIEELLEDMVNASHELGWDSSAASATIAPILRERKRRMLTKRFAIAASVVVVLAGGWFVWDKFIHHRSPYTTKTRLAVLPLANMIGSEHDAFVGGLSEHLMRVVRSVSREQPSMWTVPYVSVLNADLAKPTDAREAFGANRVLTGDVQRFRQAFRVNLKLLDTKRGREIKTASIAFEMNAPSALDSLPLVAAKLLRLPATDVSKSSLYAHDARAIPPYLEGIALIRAAGSRGPIDRALALIDSSLAFDPTYVPALCAAGNADLQLNRRHSDPAVVARALARGREARKLDASFADAHVLLGDVFQRMSEPDSVQKSFAAAITAEPGLLMATQRLGGFYSDHDRVDEAEQLYRKYISAYPDLWAGHLRLGVFFFELERTEDAAAAWQGALILAPSDPLTLMNLGAVYHRKGEWAQARALFLRSFQARPDCRSSGNVAVTYYFEQNFAEAAKYFEFALQYCDTTQHEPWGDIARALYWTPDGRPQAISLYSKALHLAQAALSHDPDDVGLLSSVIDYEAMVEHADTASAMIEHIKPLLKDNERAMYRIGAIEEKLGHREAAIDLLGDAVRHGFPVAELRADPMLKSLMTDSRFIQMISTAEAAEGAQAASKAP